VHVHDSAASPPVTRHCDPPWLSHLAVGIPRSAQVTHKEAECEHLRAQLTKAGVSTPHASSSRHLDGVQLGTDAERALHFSKLARQLELELEQVWSQPHLAPLALSVRPRSTAPGQTRRCNVTGFFALR
jgi:hypothetical protein